MTGSAFTGPVNAVLGGRPERWFTPDIIAPGDPSGLSPVRDTTTAQMQALFADEKLAKTVLQNVDVFCLFARTVSSTDADTRAMLTRLLPLLRKYGVLFGVEMAGPYGRNISVPVTGLDTGGQNGIKSADYDIATYFPVIEGLGYTIDRVRMDGAFRRVCDNGDNDTPHAAFNETALAGANNDLHWEARTAGSAGNSIRFRYVVSGNNTPLSVSVAGSDITVNVATNGSGAATSTAAQVDTAVAASGPADALVDVSNKTGNDGTGVVSALGYTNLVYGDDGVAFSITATSTETVSYMSRIHALRPDVKFLLMENAILMPYNGVAGYAAQSYPANQMPDFKTLWTTLVADIATNGLGSFFVGFVLDHVVEYLDKQVASANSNADDWTARCVAIQTQVEASGYAYGNSFNSYSMHSAYDTLHTGPDASEQTMASQVLRDIDLIETARRTAGTPSWSKLFHLDMYGYYPHTLTPQTTADSAFDLYLRALAKFERERR